MLNMILPFDSTKIEDMREILDNLPFGISIQSAERIILYENKAVRELLGSFLNDKCYKRWEYIENQGKSSCVDCPASIGFKDLEPHKVFRKTISSSNKEMFVEIQTIPITSEEKISHYIEVIRPVKLDDKVEILSKEKPVDIVKSLNYTFIRFGKTGTDIIYTDELPFVGEEELWACLYKLTTFLYTGLFQGTTYKTGFFGPLPVVDQDEYLLMTYIYNLETKQQEDPRFKGVEPAMIYFFFKKEYHFLFEKRSSIEDFLNSFLKKLNKLEELDMNFVDLFKNEFQEMILKQIDQ